jgi:hypothetical protein
MRVAAITMPSTPGCGDDSILAVSPVSTNLAFFEPDDSESDRQEIIDPDLASPGSEVTVWLFRRLGYCVLEPVYGKSCPSPTAIGQ